MSKNKRSLIDEIAIFDLDGCVSDDRLRRSMVPEGASDSAQYAAYHDACGNDVPLPIGQANLNGHIDEGRFIIFCTARPFKVADKTVAWISKYFGIQAQDDYLLIMRQDGDNRSALDVKKEQAAFVRQYSKESGRKVVSACDDRIDIAAMWHGEGYQSYLLNSEGVLLYELPFSYSQSGPTIVSGECFGTLQQPKTAAHILTDAARLFEERNAVYKDNARNVGDVMRAFFPDGVTIRTESDHHFYHLFELLVVKLTRFANSGLKHVDSIRDAAVYAAMCENVIANHNIEVH